MKHVLVTGASGFIGRNLVQSLLDSGIAVTVLVRRPQNWRDAKPKPLNIVSGDIRDFDAVKTAAQSVDGVFHLAGATTSNSLAQSRAINVGGMETLVKAIRSLPKPPKVVFVSSAAVAGPLANQGVTEEMDCQPVSNYGKTKLEAERLLRSVADDIPATIVRPPCVFGPYDQNLLMLFQSVRRGWNICAGSAHYRFSFLFVQDLLQALFCAMDRGRLVNGPWDQKNQGVYYLAHPHAVSFVEIAEWIAGCFGRARIRSLELPLALCWIVAGISEGLGRLRGRLPFINLDKMRDARVGSWICRADRASAELQFRESADLKTQIQQTFEWYQSVGWLPKRS